MKQPDKISYSRWRSILPWFCFAAAVFASAGFLYRMLWFDEVLTVQLVMNLPLERIYYAYEIPNNHIVFSLAEKIWFLIVGAIGNFSYYFFRIPPLIFCAAGIFLLSRRLIRLCGIAAGTVLPLVFGISTTFAIFSTGIRGYALGFFLTVLIFLQAEKLMRNTKISDYILYFLLAYLAMGTAPTNLAATTAVALLFLPKCVKQKGKYGRLVYLFVSPCVALLAFYLPVWEKFLGCIRLGEGWINGSSAAYNLYCSAGFTVCGLLPFCAIGVVLLWKKIPRFRWDILCGLLILLMPAGVFLIFKVPPFPRVFFPLCAVWLIVLAVPFGMYLKLMKKNRLLLILPFVIQGVLCLFFFQDRTELAASALFGKDGRNDDFILPYFMRRSFEPHKVLHFLKQHAENDGVDFHAFATFNSDAPSLFFASTIFPFPEGRLLLDRLNRPKTIRFQDYTGRKYIVCETPADLQAAMSRFGFKQVIPLAEFGIQKVYQVIE